MVKKAPPKVKVTRFNLIFLAAFLVVYATFLLPPPPSEYLENAASLVRCSLRECLHKAEKSFKMKAVLEEEPQAISQRAVKNATDTKIEVPSFFGELGKGMKIGMVNMDEDDVSELWRMHGETIPVYFERVSPFFNWTDLYPEWIDEEEESDVPSCPEIPMPEYAEYESMDVIVAKLPCNKYHEEGWGRDVFRLQVHLIAANLAVKKGKKDWRRKARVVLWSKCRPMLELFPCDQLVRREGEWWYYKADVKSLEHKVSLPVGSCKLALPLWEQGMLLLLTSTFRLSLISILSGFRSSLQSKRATKDHQNVRKLKDFCAPGIDEVYDVSKIERSVKSRARTKREAYATVLHSSEAYVCGAITLAQSLIQTGTKRDLVLLIDKSISAPKRRALASAGWKIRIITRIRNPKARKGTYNEYNYSKFRLWQLTDYDKIIFIDSDIIVLRNLDVLFHFPQISATGNDQSLFNSGVMVIEPSNCTFRTLMSLRDDIVSYNGGDQGFLNEVFVWWHRLPRRVNFLKIFWSNTTRETRVKNRLFGSEPPELYAIHYLGWKPWQCYRDYDCNWDVKGQWVYASDVAHRRWWRLHDAMDDERLQRMCRLTKRRRTVLNWGRRKARMKRLRNGHWKINITDPRRFGSLLMD